MAMLDHVDAIKSIPGYKIILTAVIKGQIQQLVEQLSYHSDEEFVLLTANVSDGTMTHIGSESGKGFIQDNEDIKSQFLRFCLEDSHMKLLTNSSGSTSSLPLFNSEPQADNSQVLKDQSPKSASIMQTRTSIGARLKPYGSRRSRKRLLPDSMTSESVSNSNNELTDDVSVIIKTEPSETFSCQESDGNRPVFIKNDTEYVENISAGLLKNYVPNVVSESQLCDDYAYTCKVNSDAKIKSDDADLLTLPIDLSEMTKSASKETKSQLCSGINNAFLDSVVDNFEAKQEHKGMLGSDTTSGHAAGKGAASMRVFACDICGKPFPSKWELGRHRRTHTGEKPYKCQFCSKAFADKSNMTQHVKSVHFREPIRKSNNS